MGFLRLKNYPLSGLPKSKSDILLDEILEDVDIDSQLIADKLKADINPKLAKINKTLDRFKNQQTATNEHRTLVKRRDFNKEILSELNLIKRKIR